MSYKFQVGDFVQIKPNANRFGDNIYFADQMYKYRGMYATILREGEDYFNTYYIDIDGEAWIWDGSWLDFVGSFCEVRE